MHYDNCCVPVPDAVTDSIIYGTATTTTLPFSNLAVNSGTYTTLEITATANCTGGVDGSVSTPVALYPNNGSDTVASLTPGCEYVFSYLARCTAAADEDSAVVVMTNSQCTGGFGLWTIMHVFFGKQLDK